MSHLIHSASLCCDKEFVAAACFCFSHSTESCAFDTCSKKTTLKISTSQVKVKHIYQVPEQSH